MPELRSDLASALELADIADRVAASRFRADDLVVDVKANGSPVSDADREIEAAVLGVLGRAAPGLPVFGAEAGPTFAGEDDFWTIDPIDGTAAFIEGKPGWGFTACRVRYGEPVAGVASSVGLGRRWWASSGEGAFVRELRVGPGSDLRLRVSTVADIAGATIGWWDGYRTELPGRASVLDASVRALRSRAESVLATGSAALQVAEGGLDAAVMRSPDDGPWHSALFTLLVREAGGIVTDFAGSGTVLFSNPHLHDDLLALLVPSAQADS
jgi:histidinol-phosphatase